MVTNAAERSTHRPGGAEHNLVATAGEAQLQDQGSISASRSCLLLGFHRIMPKGRLQDLQWSLNASYCVPPTSTRVRDLDVRNSDRYGARTVRYDEPMDFTAAITHEDPWYVARCARR